MSWTRRNFLSTIPGALLLTACGQVEKGARQIPCDTGKMRCNPFVPPHVYLTWAEQDCQTTMTVIFHSPIELESVTVHWGTAAATDFNNLAQYPNALTTTSLLMPAFGRRIHSATIRGLTPGQDYFFTISDGSKALVVERKFQTLPSSGALRFVSGGDFSAFATADQTSRMAASMSPHFALLGGDLAYADNKNENEPLWDQWFNSWTRTMITPAGYTIPLITAMGYHDASYGYSDPSESSKKRTILEDNQFANFFHLHNTEKRTYFRRQLNQDTVVYVLDTGHAFTADEQASWLAQMLAQDAAIANKFTCYHLAMHPGGFDPSQPSRVALRAAWSPLFASKIKIGFEHYDHCLKRTHPIDGTVFVGDGCWGQNPIAQVPGIDRSYLVTHNEIRHFWLVNQSGSTVSLTAYAQDGSVLDQVSV
jgi:hypothetical protein